VSVSTVLPTSTTSASQSPAFLVGQLFVRQNATTCLSLRQEHSSADGVYTLHSQPSGTHVHHISAHHPLVVDSLQLGWKPISSHRLIRTPLRTFVEERMNIILIIIAFIEIKLTNATRYMHTPNKLPRRTALYNRTQSFGTQAFNKTKHNMQCLAQNVKARL